jgi:hypothetical protein
VGSDLVDLTENRLEFRISFEGWVLFVRWRTLAHAPAVDVHHRQLCPFRALWWVYEPIWPAQVPNEQVDLGEQIDTGDK